MSDTEKIVSMNHPIKPWMMARYLGYPLIGISPNPSVVKVLLDNIRAFKILIIRS